MTPRTIKTRFAPSPTGIMHIGNLRSALYEYLIARAGDGAFILRIEDTDRERYVEGAVEAIYKTLELCGMHHDEGPDIGGPNGPYVQSERLPMYRQYAMQLIEQGDAYPCFCPDSKVAEHPDDDEPHTYGYDRTCRNIDPETARRRMEAGEPYVIRQKMPLTGETTFHDEVYGSITVQNKELEDQILLKTDGYPTYNFANVIDDHLMEITHIVRGSEYLSSTPKYCLLYDAFGWPIPNFVHLPLIVGEDGKKLSKRHGATSFNALVEAGYLPEAIVNMIAFLGWAPGDDTREIFSLGELESIFRIHGINKAPAVFSYEKLDWMNEQYIHQMDDQRWQALVQRAADPVFGDQAYDLDMLAQVLKPRTTKLSDIPDMIRFFVEDQPLDDDVFFNKRAKLNTERAADILADLIPKFEQLPEWNAEAISALLNEHTEATGLKKGQVMGAVRVALARQKVTPGGATECAVILGRDRSLDRFEKAMAYLKGA